MWAIDEDQFNLTVCVEIRGTDARRRKPPVALANIVVGRDEPGFVINRQPRTAPRIGFHNYDLGVAVAIHIDNAWGRVLKHARLGQYKPQAAALAGLDHQRAMFDGIAENTMCITGCRVFIVGRGDPFGTSIGACKQ